MHRLLQKNGKCVIITHSGFSSTGCCMKTAAPLCHEESSLYCGRHLFLHKTPQKLTAEQKAANSLVHRIAAGVFPTNKTVPSSVRGFMRTERDIAFADGLIVRSSGRKITEKKLRT